MMRQDIGLVTTERNSEQVLCTTCPVRDAETIDVKRNVPTYDARRYGQRLPDEKSINQRDLVFFLGK